MKVKTKICLLAFGLGLSLAQYNIQTQRGGSRSTIVHLFEWRWNDIAEECERYLGPNGFDGVQISPPSENVMVTKPWRPWWERYQPVSYNLCSRSGTEQELRDMICRCNKVGVKIYADVVINHMCSSGAGEGSRSTCGSYFNASAREFPSVPYAARHFNDDKCTTRSGDIESYQDIYQVIDLGGEPIKANQYFGLGLVTEFKYGAKLGSIIRRWNGGMLSDLKSWGEPCGLMPSENALVFVDNHDNQRGHGAGGDSILTFWEPRMYKMATAFMLAHPYGQPRVMSSYRWDRHLVKGKDVNDWMGPPSFPDGSTKPVAIQSDGSCGGGWVCEHRWPPIRNMVIFRKVVGEEPLCNWWDNGKNQIAFGRGKRGFIAINNDDCELNRILQTGLPKGTYCDVISGQKEGTRCSGKRITVDDEGRAHITVSHSDKDPIIAIHTEAKL